MSVHVSAPPASEARAKNWKRAWLTGGSLIALLAGFGLGILAHRDTIPSLVQLSDTLAPIGTAWTNALRMTVTPLIVAQLILTLITARRPGAAGRIGALSFGVFTTMLIAGGIMTALGVPLLLGAMDFTPDALNAFRAASPEVPRQVAGPSSPVAWLTGLVPANALRAAVQDELIGVLIFAAAFGVAVGRMADESRTLIATLCRVVVEAMMAIVHWILWIMPVAVFVLSLSTATRAGFGALDVMFTFVLLTCGLLLALTLLLYPVSAALGGVRVSQFARAALPVQLVALSTRSSVAALPALVEAADQRLRLKPEVTNLVMPLAVSTFKLNRTTTAVVQFLFLAYVSGVELSVLQVIGFMTATLILSYSTLGIPSGGSMMRSAPLYLAAGIPIEAYLLTEAVDTVPDIFKTLVNVTGNLAAATIVNRRVLASESVVGVVPSNAALEA